MTAKSLSVCSHMQAHAQASAAFQAAQHAQHAQQAQRVQAFVVPPPPPPSNPGFGNSPHGAFGHNENWNRGKCLCCYLPFIGSSREARLFPLLKILPCFSCNLPCLPLPCPALPCPTLSPAALDCPASPVIMCAVEASRYKGSNTHAAQVSKLCFACCHVKACLKAPRVAVAAQVGCTALALLLLQTVSARLPSHPFLFSIYLCYLHGVCNQQSLRKSVKQSGKPLREP